MTEAEWLSVRHHSQAMVLVMRGTRTRAGKRKLRLFACACCRLAWEFLLDPRLRRAVEVAEEFAEGTAGKPELEAAEESARATPGPLTPQGRTAASMARAVGGARAFDSAFSMTAQSLPLAGRYGAREAEAVLCGLLRCVIGNPFRPLPSTPILTPIVVSLAQAAYDERLLPSGELDPARLAVLSDALEDAGCADAILSHLRASGPHVRGCWALDLILGKG
jgi:hypothetical protein